MAAGDREPSPGRGADRAGRRVQRDPAWSGGGAAAARRPGFPASTAAGGQGAGGRDRRRLGGGVPFPGVQVRLRTSAGTLYSGGKVLVTDSSGRTRDRLTTHSSAHVTLNAG